MNAGAPGIAAADAARRFVVTITVHRSDPEGLLRMVSVFHRRQVEILHATYSSAGSHRWMAATVDTVPSRLRTLTLTLANTVGVTGYEVTPCDDDDHDADPASARRSAHSVPSDEPDRRPARRPHPREIGRRISGSA